MLYVLKTYPRGIVNASNAQYEYFTSGELALALHIAKLRDEKRQKPVLMKYDSDGASLVWTPQMKKAA